MRRVIVIATIAGSMFAATAVAAQTNSQDSLPVTPSIVDDEAASQATVVQSHIMPARTPEGAAWAAAAGRATNLTEKSASQNASSQGIVIFPADLSNQGGAVVHAAESHAIYMNPSGKCTVASCWGNPQRFLGDLAQSEFIHVADQYVGDTASQRYTDGFSATVKFTQSSTPFTDKKLRGIVHAVAARTGATGYGHIYHIFLPKGTDVCITSTDGICYSPNNPNTFVFCAYHSSVTFTDIGHVLYTVEPFQDVRGCRVQSGTPNGQLADSTNSTLSHELFETITDPDGTAWFNTIDLILSGAEIADECQLLAAVPAFTIGSRTYAVQLEYANSQHACADQP